MITKDKLYIGIIVVALAAAGYFWYSKLKAQVKQSSIISWVKNGYAQQFCSVIYPHLANCLTLSATDCNKVATAQINACIDASKSDLPESTDQKNAKKIYDSFRQCFQSKMHDAILQSYAVDTPECLQRLK